MSPVALALVCIVALILLGCNISASFLAVSIVFTLIDGGRLTGFLTTAFSAANSYSLLAVPLFSLGGLLMEKSGIADKLVDWCQYLLRRVKGGMGAVITLASLAFGMLTGSALATVNTIGNIMIPRLEKLGWDKRYTAAMVAAAAPLGYMIPPNMNAIIFALVSPASVSELFLASIVPGVLWGLGYIVLNRLVYKKWTTRPDVDEEEIKRITRKPDGKERNFLQLTLEAIPAFMMPVIIIGGIYGGLFSPTEAGAISALYAILIGVFLYRKLNGKGLLKCFSATGRSLGVILVVMPLASIFTKIMIMEGFPDQVMSILTGFAGNRVVLLLLLDLAFLLAGCFFEANVLTLVIPPIMMPTMNALGIDPVQFGNIVFVAIGIGAATPPMASALFMSAKIADVKIADVVKPLMPFLLLVGVPIMLLVTFVPELSLWLPRLILGA